jgi:hypothetical protein
VLVEINAWHPVPAPCALPWELDRRLQGDPARQNLYESDTPSISERIGVLRDGHWQTRQMPTTTQRRDLEIATAGLDALERDLKALIAGDLAKLEEAFAAAGSPSLTREPLSLRFRAPAFGPEGRLLSFPVGAGAKSFPSRASSPRDTETNSIF